MHPFEVDYQPDFRRAMYILGRIEGSSDLGLFWLKLGSFYRSSPAIESVSPYWFVGLEHEVGMCYNKETDENP